MPEDNDTPLVMPEHYVATVATFKRFERRSGVKLFAALADAIKEAGEAVDGISFAKAIFTDSESLAAFIYECGLSDKQREEMTFEAFESRVTIAEVFGEYDRAISALFTFSPPQKTETRETGNEETTKATESEEKVTT